MTRYTFIITVISITSLNLLQAAHVRSQSLEKTSVLIKAENTALSNILTEVERQTEFSFSYSKEVGNTEVSLTGNSSRSLANLIRQLEKGKELKFTQMGNLLAVSRASKPAPHPQTQQPGRISGKLLDQEGRMLPGASVRISQGANMSTQSDAEGNYRLELPAGTYNVEVSYIGYKTQQVTGVKVTAGKNTTLDLVMEQGGTNLETVVITSTFSNASAKGLYARQKANTAMTDGISAEQIGKTSDNNAAQVLRRVAGVNIDDGKYAVIRGMSERYNNVQLNGASLPSTEPNRRNFAFDVVPSGLVDNVVVYKTFMPDLNGEFTGGLVEVNTLAVPENRMLNLSLGTGMNGMSTGKDFYSNKRFGNDRLFGEVDGRKWYTGKSEQQSQQNIINAGNSNTYGLGKYTAQPLQNYSLSAGMPFDLGTAGKLGVVAALTYRHEENREEILEGHMINRDSIYRPSFGNGSFRYKAVTTTGAVANIGWEKERNKISWRNLFNNRFSHTNQERYTWESYGTYQNRNTMYEQYSVPLNSRLWQTQLDGKHNLLDNKLILTWNGSINKVTRTNPDDRFAMGVVMGESPQDKQFVDWSLSTYNSNSLSIGDSHIMYSNLDENKKTAGANLEFPFTKFGNTHKIKGGYLGTFRNAIFEQQYLKAGGNIDQFGLIGNSIQDYFAPGNFGDGNPLHYDISGMQANRADYYEGRQDIHAGYLMGDFGLFKKLRLIGGVRMENTDMSVTTELLTMDVGAVPVDSTINQRRTDWLPAATAIYSITPKLNVRAAYSKTVARPDFRELSPASYYNVDDRIWIINQYAIEQSHTHNMDFRAEWYPRAGEVLSVSYFRKKFIKPVEMIVRMRSDQQNFDSYGMNLDNATSNGVELNVRKSLDFAGSEQSFLKDLYLTGNYTWTKSNVTYNQVLLFEGGYMSDADKERYNTDAFKRERPLQGLSPYTLNMGLVYEGSRIGAAVNYNRSGRRLVYAGEFEKHDQYENPRDVLDLQLSTKLMKQRMELKFNVSDLLNQDFIIYRNSDYDPGNDLIADPGVYHDRTSLGMNYNAGDWVMSRIKRGVNCSFSVNYKF